MHYYIRLTAFFQDNPSKPASFWILLELMQVLCTSLLLDNHASTSPLSFYRLDMPFLLPNQQRQSIEGTFIAK